MKEVYLPIPDKVIEDIIFSINTRDMFIMTEEFERKKELTEGQKLAWGEIAKRICDKINRVL